MEIVYDPQFITTTRNIYGELDSKIEKIVKKIHTTTKLSLWRNPAHISYKSKRRRRR